MYCAYNATFSLSKDFSVYSFGENKFGNLGFPNEDVIKIPRKIESLCNIKMISCGLDHTLCINFDGTLFSFGYNKFGQLGIGKDEESLSKTYIPQKVMLPPVDYISSGDDFTVCVTFDKKLYSFGNNEYGQLGIGNKTSFSAPQLIPDISNIESVQCSAYRSICKTITGEYHSWGDNRYGQLGHENDSCEKPIKCLNWPENIIQYKCGYFHSLILTSTGYVYSFGRNEYGELGLNDKNIESINIPTLIKDIPEIKKIECGYLYSMCLDINDKLWVFGWNGYGQLGLRDFENRYKPILNEALNDIIDISSGGDHIFAKTINNEIYACGYNEFSQLGIDTNGERYLKEPILVLKDNEEIWATNIFRSKQKSARK